MDDQQMFLNKFIAATKEYCTFTEHVPAPYFRKNFSVDKNCVSATLKICGLGFYELYLDGEKLNKGYLSSYISNPDDILYYDEYDVTESLITGEHTIGVCLGNGFLNSIGGEVWFFQFAKYRSAPKFALEIKICYEDGTTEEIFSDESFKTHTSPILFDDLRAGEIYNACLEIKDWNKTGFDDADWNNAIYAETPRGEYRISEAEPIVIEKSLKPIAITKGKLYCAERIPTWQVENIPIEENPEGYIYDFGVNTAGNVRLRINGKQGQKIMLQFGERLSEDGNLDMRGMNFQPQKYNHRIYYTCKEGDQEYFPSFTYHGFRYCLVQGITQEQANDDLLTYEVMHSDLKSLASFTCSDETINKLQEAVLNSDLSNFFYFPTDCPHREKNGWTADAALSAEQMLLNFNPENSYKEWLRNIRKTQNERGALPGIIPTAGWGYEWGNGPAWDYVLIALPYYVWLYRGDTEIIKENAHAIMSYLDYISKRRDEKGLLHIGLGDWLAAGRENGRTPLFVTDTLVSMNICRKAATLFSAVGYDLQASFAESLFSQLKASARKYLLEKDCATVFGYTQTSQVLGIQYGLFEESEKVKAFDVLLEIIRKNNNRLDVGILGAREVFHVLSDFGYSELAFDMIKGPEYPSYGYWIKEFDATTLFEAFRTVDQDPISQNHHMFGDISAWYYKQILGIKVNPFEEDCNEVEISPEFVSQLDYAKGEITLNCGKLSVEWFRQDKNIIFKVDAPSGCNGFIRLKNGYCFAENEASFESVESKEYTIVPFIPNN